MRGRLLVLALLVVALPLAAQTTFRMMSYNLLNFPTNNPWGKEDTLAKILAYHPVDLLVVQELRNAGGADLILYNSLNVNGVTRFSAAPFVEQQSDPFSQVKLSQLLYYDHELFTLVGQETLLTNVRDINVYMLYVNADDLSQTQDTTFFTVYAVHLKASSGTSNEQARLQMAQVLMDHLDQQPSGTRSIVLGDMNLYGADEPAYQLMTGAGSPLEDLLQFPGSWNFNVSMAEQHTQSTRSSQLFGDGAGGGLDDRFDLALFSNTLLGGNQDLHVVPGSYGPLGNNGNCFNSSILDCVGGSTPYAILRALFYMSDHLPVVFELGFNGTATGIAEQGGPSTELRAGGQGSLLIADERPGSGTLVVFDALARRLSEQRISWPAGLSEWDMDQAGASGLRIVQLQQGDRVHVLRLPILLE